MSIVGPRPEVPKYATHYPDIVFSVRPGITSLASIEYIEENAVLANSSDPEKSYIDEILPVKIAYYESYIASRSFTYDLMIIIKTLTKVFFCSRGANCSKKTNQL